MLKFIKAKEIANETGLKFKAPEDTALTGAELGTLTMMVLNRFMEQVEWETITSVYLSGLVDETDMAIIQRAVKSLVDGGVEFV